MDIRRILLLEHLVGKAEEENQILRDALKQYADGKNWEDIMNSGYLNVWWPPADGRKVAREALGKVER